VTPFKEDFLLDIEALKRIVHFSIDGNWVFGGFGYNGWKCNIIPRWKEIVIKTVIKTMVVY
jgi:4-hydroxy-tetrahydrodipicolinate synthase